MPAPVRVLIIFLITLFQFTTPVKAQKRRQTWRRNIGADSIFPTGHFRLSTDLVKASVNEFQFIGEYRISRLFSVGVIYGKIHHNNLFDPWFLSPSQQDWPGTAYHGDAYTVLFKCYPFRRKWLYIGLKGIYKSECYSNQYFAQGTGYGHYLDQNRSETARVTGMDLVIGRYRFYSRYRIRVELFSGIGYRVRDRNFTIYSERDDWGQPVTYYSNPSAYPFPTPFPIHEQLNQSYFTLQLGVLIGLNVGSGGISFRK